MYNNYYNILYYILHFILYNITLHPIYSLIYNNNNNKTFFISGLKTFGENQPEKEALFSMQTATNH